MSADQISPERTAVQTAPATWVLLPDRRILAGSAVSSTLGVSEHSVLDVDALIACFSSQYQPALERGFRQLLEEQCSFSLLAQTVSSTSRLFLLSAEAQFDQQTQQHHYIGTLTELSASGADISAEKYLTDRLRAAIGRSPIPMLLAFGDQILGISDSWYRLSGRKRTDFRTLSDWFRLAHGQTESEVEQLLRSVAAESDNEYSWSSELVTDGGAMKVWEYHGSRINRTESQHSLLIIIATDISEKAQAERQFSRLLAGISHSFGEQLYQKLVSSLAEVLSVDAALVGVRDPENPRQINSLAFWLDGELVEPVSYSLDGTPCDKVSGSEACLFSSGVAEMFPEDKELAELEIEGYLGIPLLDSAGNVTGLIVLLSRQPLDISPALASFLRILASRVEVEVQRSLTVDRLSHTEFNLRKAHQIASLGSWTVEIDAQRMYGSPEMKAIFGEPTKEGYWTPEQLHQVLYPEDLKLVERLIWQGNDSDRQYRFSFRAVMANQRVCSIRAIVEPVIDEYGRLTRLMAVFQDVSEEVESQRKIDESEQRYRNLIDISPYGITEVDTELRFTFANDVTHQVLGYSPGSLIGMKLIDTVPEEDRARFGEKFRRLMRRPAAPKRYQRRALRKDGSIRILEVAINPQVGIDGKLTGFIGFIDDITDKVQQEQRLRQLSTAVEQSPSAITITSQSGELEYVNPAYQLSSGLSLDQAKRLNQQHLVEHGIPLGLSEDAWRAAQTGCSWQGEIESDKAGQACWEWVNVAPILQEQELTHIVTTREDISLRKEQEQLLAYQANYDSVTGLPNRALAMDRLNHAIATSHRNKKHTVVMFVDLDHFKRVNDTFGHSVGDQLLKTASRLLQQSLREHDTIARFGGDEFLVIMDDIPNAYAMERVAEKVLWAFNEPLFIEDHELLLTSSIGVAVYPQDGEDSETLLRNADAAMYIAKQRGRNSYHFFSPEMNDHAKRRLLLESHLRRAREFDELTLVYQPVMEVATGNLVAAEALLRWQNQKLGNVTPDQFIPLAEDLGLIDQLGTWVIEQVLKQYQSWQPALPKGFKMAINVSPKQFQRGSFSDELLRMMAEYEVPPAAVELEVTEGLLMNDWPEVADQIIRLRQAGISFSIDDFGTGYASISYLRRYPFSTLKIDRSFVQDIHEDEADTAMVQSILMLARGMGLRTIAEGVETAEQLRFLQDRGCEMIQGYLLSKPVSPQEFTRLMNIPETV